MAAFGADDSEEGLEPEDEEEDEAETDQVQGLGPIQNVIRPEDVHYQKNTNVVVSTGLPVMYTNAESVTLHPPHLRQAFVTLLMRNGCQTP